MRGRILWQWRVLVQCGLYRCDMRRLLAKPLWAQLSSLPVFARGNLQQRNSRRWELHMFDRICWGHLWFMLPWVLWFQLSRVRVYQWGPVQRDNQRRRGVQLRGQLPRAYLWGLYSGLLWRLLQQLHQLRRARCV